MKPISARRQRQIAIDKRIHGFELGRYPLYRAIADTVYSPRMTINAGMTRAEKQQPEFSGAKEARDFLRTVQRSSFVREHYPRMADAHPVEVELHHRQGACTIPDTQIIYFAPDGMALTRYAALHEFGHLVMVYELEMYRSCQFFMGDKFNAHSSVYAGIHLKLMQEFLPEKALAFTRAYKRHNVEIEALAGHTWRNS